MTSTSLLTSQFRLTGGGGGGGGGGNTKIVDVLQENILSDSAHSLTH